MINYRGPKAMRCTLEAIFEHCKKNRLIIVINIFQVEISHNFYLGLEIF